MIEKKFAARILVAQMGAVAMIALITAKFRAVMKDVLAKTATIHATEWKRDDRLTSRVFFQI